MENFMVFDTETTSIDKPFCYNIGYVIANENETLVRKSFVVEQIWHNLPLFNTAYYAEKRPLYVSAMKARKTVLDKFGYICREMARDIKQYNVKFAFAYNSPFDEKVFNFNCDWFKCLNPFDTVIIKDIRAFAHKYIVNEDYMQFCELNEQFTDSGNYSTTAETMFRYIANDIDFIEDHTALSDSIIELEILRKCLRAGANLDESLVARRSIERKVEKTLHIQTAEKEDFYFDYSMIRINKAKTEIKLK
jgi:hypothetical protein